MAEPVRVQGAAANNATSADLDVTLSPAPVEGNSLVMYGGSSTAGMTVTSVTLDPAGVNQAFTQGTVNDEGAGVDPTQVVFYLTNVAASPGSIVRIVKSSGFHANVIELSGTAEATIEDGAHSVHSQAAGTSGDSGAGSTPSVSHDMLIGGIQTDGDHGGITWGNNGQGGTYAASSNTPRSGLGFFAVTTALLYDAKMTWVNSLAWSAAFTAIKGVAPDGANFVKIVAERFGLAGGKGLAG